MTRDRQYELRLSKTIEWQRSASNPNRTENRYHFKFDWGWGDGSAGLDSSVFQDPKIHYVEKRAEMMASLFFFFFFFF